MDGNMPFLVFQPEQGVTAVRERSFSSGIGSTKVLESAQTAELSRPKPYKEDRRVGQQDRISDFVAVFLDGSRLRKTTATYFNRMGPML